MRDKKASKILYCCNFLGIHQKILQFIIFFDVYFIIFLSSKLKADISYRISAL